MAEYKKAKDEYSIPYTNSSDGNGGTKKYEEHPQCINQNRILPVLSNQKMNAYLKEIGDICGINT
jgi:hypothetical protein